MSAAFRTGLGATFPFLSDKDKTAIEQLDIVNISKGHDNVPGRGAIAIPYSFSLMPDFAVHNIYNGYWFFGRPTVDQDNNKVKLSAISKGQPLIVTFYRGHW